MHKISCWGRPAAAMGYFWALVVVLGGAPALGQTDLSKLSIDDLMNVTIESVSKFEQKVIEAPASVSIVTSDDIKVYGYRNLGEILQSVRGLFVRNDRRVSYLGIRGFDQLGNDVSRFLLLVDGHRMNDSYYGKASIANDFNIDVDLIDRVEVIRGASSSVYGTSAFLGVVNVKTKSGVDLRSVELAAEGGTFSTYRGRATYGNRFANGLDVLLSTGRFGSRGDQRLFFKEFNDPATNFGIAKNDDDESAGNFFGKVSFRDFILEGGYIRRTKDIPTGSFDTVFNDDRTRLTDGRGFVDLKFQREFANSLGVKARLYYDRFKEKGDYIVDYAAPGDPPFIVKNIDLFRTQAIGSELQLSKTLFGSHKFILGAEYNYVFQQDQRNYDVDVYLDKRTTSRDWAVFIQDEFELFRGFRVSAGLRYDQYSSFGGTLNPRVGLVYQPFDKTILKLLYGTAFRAPSAFERFYNDGGDTQIASPNIGPEKIRSVEFSAQQYLGFNLWGSAHAYYQWISDRISEGVNSSGLLFYENTKGVTQKGAEFELEGRWQNGVRGRLSYALQESTDRTSGKVVQNSPTHLIKFNGVVPLWSDKLSLGVEEQFVGTRKTVANDRTESVFITNLTLFSSKVFKGWEATASLYNVFNRKYDDPAGPEHVQDKIQQDGRSFRFKLTYRF